LPAALQLFDIGLGQSCLLIFGSIAVLRHMLAYDDAVAVAVAGEY
jgi:hypothetical protein